MELAEAPGYERRQIAQTLLYLHHDLSEEARTAGVLSALDPLRGGGYPDEIERLAAFLEQPENRAVLLASYSAFMDAYQQDRNVLRFNYHRPAELQARLRELDAPRTQYHSDMARVPEVKPFITEDEIDAALTGGSGFSEGKGRIYAYFTADHTAKEKADCLKNEYGVGGRSHALSRSDGSSEDHDGRGIQYKKVGCVTVQLNWNQVAKRLDRLIQQDRYMTPDDKQRYEEYRQKQEAIAQREFAFITSYGNYNDRLVRIHSRIIQRLP